MRESLDLRDRRGSREEGLVTRVKQRIEARRQRNHALAVEDAKHRCGWCKVRLEPGASVFVLFGDPARYCSEACRDDARDSLEVRI